MQNNIWGADRAQCIDVNSSGGFTLTSANRNNATNGPPARRVQYPLGRAGGPKEIDMSDAQIDEVQIMEALTQFGRALSAGDTAAAAAGWALPALVLSDEQTVPVSEQHEVEAFYRHAVAWYRSQGLMSTKPELERVTPLTNRLAAVDVRWPALDAQGTEKSSERSHYIMRLGDDGEARIQVALVATA